MPRIVVFDDAADPDVLLNEPVAPEHLEDERSTAQLLQRLCSAVRRADRQPTRTCVQAVTPYDRVQSS